MANCISSPRWSRKGELFADRDSARAFNQAGDPMGVERLGIALEPEADMSGAPTAGEAAKISRHFRGTAQRYIMTYAGIFATGTKESRWQSQRIFSIGNVSGSQPTLIGSGIELADVDDKDASLFPVGIPNSADNWNWECFIRPLFPGTRPRRTACQPGSRQVDLNHESIWISYCPACSDERVAGSPGPVYISSSIGNSGVPLERLKIGAGTPPILTKHGWLIVYHGVSEVPAQVEIIRCATRPE